MQKRIVTLLVAKPGNLRDSLAMLLLALPQIVAVKLAGDAASALQIMGTHRPALVVLDLGLPGAQSWTVLRQIKLRWPYMKCVLLADTVKYMHQAQVYGADKILLKGYSAAKLSSVIENILN